MLDLSTAVLCDFAQVRDRLLFVASGAVSRLYRQELPSPLGLMVGLVIEVPLEDAGMDHRLRAEVINRHGTVLATLENLFRVSDAGLFPHEVQQVPLVLSITGVRARTWGTHQVRLYLDDELVRALTLYVVPAAGAQGPAVRTTPTQSRAEDDQGSLGGTSPAPVAAGDAPGEGEGPGTAAFELTDEPGAEGGEARPDAGAEAPVPAPPTPEPAPADEGPTREAVSWGVPSDPEGEEPGDEPAPEAEEAPTRGTATIAAEPADDDADAAAPEAETGDEGEGEASGGSRFAFRYRYEDDEG